MNRWVSAILLIVVMSFMLPDVAFAEDRIAQSRNKSYGDHLARINDNGKVVWYERSVSVSEISLYDDKTTTMPTEDSIDDCVAAMNDNGHLVWKGRGHNKSDLEIFLNDGTCTTNVSNNSYSDYYPQINNGGEIVWRAQRSSLNTLALLLVPVGAVTALRFWRRKR